MLYVATDSGYIPATAHHILRESVAVARKSLQGKPDLRNTEKAEAILIPLLAHRREESMSVAFVDTQCNMLSFEELWLGSLTSTPCYPRKIVERALKLNASGVILVHNHPAGVCKPSKEDINTTVRLKMLLQDLEIELHDHLVVAKDGVTSIAKAYSNEMKKQTEEMMKDLNEKLLSIFEVAKKATGQQTG